jgi:hypothetical protein
MEVFEGFYSDNGGDKVHGKGGAYLVWFKGLKEARVAG